MSKKLTNKTFIEKVIKVKDFSNYDYSEINYVNSRTKINVVCKEHGAFQTKPNNLLTGYGCPKCGILKNSKQRTKGKKYWINKFEKALGENNKNLDYSKSVFVNSKTPITIICSKHGEFNKTPYSLAQSKGCPKCSNERTGKSLRRSVDEWREIFSEVHENKYSYPNQDFEKDNRDIKIICPNHGEFYQKKYNHKGGNGCPNCAVKRMKSLGEEEVFNFLSNLTKDKLISNDRIILQGRELDILIPSKNVAVEYNGLYWHSDKFSNKTDLLDKTTLTLNKNISLVHIFEDEWNNKKEIVKSRLLSILGQSNIRIFARQCEIKNVDTQTVSKFLNENHLQGRTGSKVKLGLYYEEQLVSLMCFGNQRISLGRKKEEGCYELIRFCNKLNTNVVGGASKLLKHFEKNYKPKKIISYCDRRWSEGAVYEKIGFTFIKNTEPNYFYTKRGRKRYNRFKFRKSILIKEGYDASKTEKSIMQERGFYRIYDCGNKLFEKIY